MTFSWLTRCEKNIFTRGFGLRKVGCVMDEVMSERKKNRVGGFFKIGEIGVERLGLATVACFVWSLELTFSNPVSFQSEISLQLSAFASTAPFPSLHHLHKSN